ncbi:MAG: hypothetical protein N3D73_01170 [Candidatus Diapherotrites archaeon]|nr:hypothetical protein [Candidatus Diapherotrites archaeon]
MKRKLCLILDASAIINSQSFVFSEEFSYYMTPNTILELKDFRSKLLVDNALKNKTLKIRVPSKKSLVEAKKKASEINTAISEADLSVVALALDFIKKNKNFLVITDDYSIQNVLAYSKIPFNSAIYPEIKKIIIFKKKTQED